MRVSHYYHKTYDVCGLRLNPMVKGVLISPYCASTYIRVAMRAGKQAFTIDISLSSIVSIINFSFSKSYFKTKFSSFISRYILQYFIIYDNILQ